ncbi:MAG: methyltransferase domain-containing protein [Candidatus Aminicenantes bacterium]|nr:methyltransferase domain-containing protein [Candidatus Aminicenantes bacterium]
MIEKFRKILKVLFHRKGRTTAYRYRSKDNFANFAKQTEILKERLKNKNEVFTGWPGIIYSEKENKALITQLEKKKITALSYKVGKNEYEHFLSEINYKKKYPRYYSFNFPEKTLEHFVAFKLLNLKKGDKFIDIAAEQSPHSREFSRLTGCIGYRQDIMFRPGIHGRKIGGNAAEIPVADNFFQGALAACSIEHFEKDSDSEFMREMSRVLTKGGKCVIIPLYLHKNPFCVADPRYSIPGGVKFDPGIDVHCVREFQNRHGRYYSPDTLYQRLIEPNKSRMNFTIYYIENFKEIDESNYCRFALVGEKK